MSAVIEANEQTWHEWERSMRGRRLSPNTVYRHRKALEQLAAHAGGADLLSLAKTDIQEWLASMAGWRSSSVMTRFSSARAFYNWASEDGEGELIGLSPMRKIRAPLDPAPLVAIPDIGDIRTLLAGVRGRSLADRRDNAMIRVMLEPGSPRASETAALGLADVDLRRDDVTVIEGKGGKSRVFPLSATTAGACSRYGRARKDHPRAPSPRWLLGKRGPMTRDGVGDILERRSRDAGIRPVSPHQLRHLAAHRFFLAGGREGDAMRLFGWSDPAMPRRYAAAAAAARASDAARVLALGDEL